MQTKLIATALISLVIGIGGTYAVMSKQVQQPTAGHMMPNGQMMSDDLSGMHGAMTSMMVGLEGKTGDAFDKAFLSEMIMHHEGAVEMAEAAKVNAKHAEIKQMADAIISAQTTEIAQMREWQKAWYGGE